ncbi:lipopolysaccharide biosynthesis protein [Segetibacter koreensis]|uniref:lipopolysaccharide biosynthesis protein n=1 Tax=Segetibacter koreensis TaxID=398037 RepID=UPI00039DD5E0|nr:oligosaccharide flippase family protein [Segetibacter koreensis]
MSGIKKLAGQTMWYGVSSIAARFINYLLTPYLTSTSVLQVSDYGKLSLVYAAIPLLNVLFTYGFETAYFRFSQRKEFQQSIYSTASISLFISTIIFSLVLWIFHNSLASLAGIPGQPYLIKISILIIALDALATIPFAKLRHEGRPIKYAFIRIIGILVNIAATIFFLSYCPKIIVNNPNSWISLFYRTDVNPVTYVVIATLLQSGLTLLLLMGQIGAIKLEFNKVLWKEMILYALPLIIVGLGGMINETFDRLMLNWWVPGSITFKEEQVGIYSACYKLSLLISLFTQAFRMGAEPFFFKQAEGLNPQRTYARVMKFFVITVTLMFLLVSLFLPVFKYFVGRTYWVGLGVVPILLLANIFLGIYYNLSIWYKLGNKTKAGAYITITGAAITILINRIFIPHYSFLACAWATFFCYGSMMVISFAWGQKEYRIPYPTKKLIAYIVIVVTLYFIHRALTSIVPQIWFSLFIGALLLFIYTWFILLIEKEEFKKFPVIGKFIK